MWRFLILLLVVPTSAIGAGYFNPDVEKMTYKNVLFVVPVQDLRFREVMEKEAIEYTRKYTESAGKKSLDLFPPLQEITADIFKERIKKSEIDAVIVIEPTDQQGSYPPIYRYNSSTFAMKYVSTRHNRKIDATVTLYDGVIGKAVWVLPLSFVDDGNDIIEEVASRAVKNLRSVNLLQPKPKKKRSWFSGSSNQGGETTPQTE